MVVVALVGVCAGNLAGQANLLKPNGHPPQTAPSMIAAEQEVDSPTSVTKQKRQVVKTDNKTGMERPVFADIRLSVRSEGHERTALLEMMYSNVMQYSFIPERIARELGAEELGVIDFGTEAPQRPRMAQQMLIVRSPDAAPDESPEGESKPQLAASPVTVDSITEPLQGDAEFDPYESDPIFVPAHLGFYGINRTGQHRFRVVRIDRVDLGIGPSFGPINALVLDDDNSEFGVLGIDWAAQPRGDAGEGLWFAAADQSFYFMRGPDAHGSDQPAPDESPSPDANDQNSSNAMIVTGTPTKSPDGMDRPGVRVIASQDYGQARRESTAWIDFQGSQIPVDDGVDFNGFTVYESLFYDVYGVDSETKRVLWKVDGAKSEPFWTRVSIIEYVQDGQKRHAVELFAWDERARSMIRKDVSLDRGEPVDVRPDPIQEETEQDADRIPEIRPVKREGDHVTIAVTEAVTEKRNPRRLLELLRQVTETEMTGNITDHETIVSAANPNYLLNDGMDAPEVTFNLPEGSGLRAEFRGSPVTIEPREDDVVVTITHGRLELIDAGGVVRAWASPDGGAERLVVVCRIENDETVMTMRTARIEPSADDPDPPVQVKMNIASGAADDEADPPHGSIRFEINPPDSQAQRPAQMKMLWRYDVSRLAAEAAQEREEKDRKPDTAEEAVDQAESNPEAVDDSDDWGPAAGKGDLRIRLTILDAEPAVGDPVRLKLEIKNFGGEPQSYDPQYYASFRVLKVERADGEPDLFVGMTPQTSGVPVQLAPGDVAVVWESEDAAELYLLEEGTYRLWVAAPALSDDRLPPSNEVTLRMGPGELPPLKRLLKELSTDLPARWQLSSGFGAVFLTHVPTSLKRDASAIQIWFTDEELAGDFELGKGDQRQLISYLGRGSLGHFNVGAQPAAIELWPDYLESIRRAARTAGVVQAGESDDADPVHQDSTDDAAADKLPWEVTGKVSDRDGRPLEGAEIRAHCGMGTLHQTGSAVSGPDGRFRMRFGPGIWSEDRTAVQAATISVHLPGHFEKNMHRQGDLLAALEPPAGELEWVYERLDDVILPGKPREIDFVMLPAARFKGMLKLADWKPAANYRVSLTGDQLPPSSSVVDEVRTDENGAFEMADIPTGFPFQVLVEPPVAEHPWLGWASPPVEFVFASEDGESTSLHCVYNDGQTRVDFSTQALYLVLMGDGANWRTELAGAAQRPFEPKYDGLSTADGRMVRAGMTTIELGAAR
jgi:hypothetical protein